jgi:hypothetical protein
MSKSKRAQSIKARSASKIRSKAATRGSAARHRTRSSPLPKSRTLQWSSMRAV